MGFEANKAPGFIGREPMPRSPKHGNIHIHYIVTRLSQSSVWVGGEKSLVLSSPQVDPDWRL